MDKPAAPHSPSSFKMLPVPSIVMLSTTNTKHEWPLLDLFTAPLKVTLACGMYMSPVMSQVGLLPAYVTLTPEVVRLGSW